MKNVVIQLIGLFILVGATASSQEISRKDAEFLRTVRELRKKDKKAATASLAKRVKETPTDVHLFELGLWQAEDGNDNGAIATYRALMKRAPNYPGAMRNLGIILLRKRKYADAIGVLSKLSRREGLGADLQRSLGVAYSVVGNHSAALAAYRRAVIGFPNDDGLQLSIAQTLFDLNALDEAEAKARHILSRAPATTSAWLIVGKCNVAKQRYGKAADAFEAARGLTEKPSDELVVALGDLYLALKLPKVAWECYASALDVAGGRLAELGRQFIHDGEVASALAIASTLKKSPKLREESHLLVGLCELAKKRYPEAEKALKAALKAAPTNGEILASLGDVARKQGKANQAVSWYRSARSSTTWKRYAMEAELDLHLELKNYDKARHVLTELNRSFPAPYWNEIAKELPIKGAP